MIALAKVLAKELGKRGTSNAIAPGVIDTSMTRNQTRGTGGYLKMIPIGRLGKPEDVANAVMFLACEEGITGQVLPDGRVVLVSSIGHIGPIEP